MYVQLEWLRRKFGGTLVCTRRVADMELWRGSWMNVRASGYVAVSERQLNLEAMCLRWNFQANLESRGRVVKYELCWDSWMYSRASG